MRYLSQEDLNKCLYSLLGSDDFVSRWWTSPNANWSMRRPIDVYEVYPAEVTNYILQFMNEGDL